MRIVILDGYTANPGDLSWEGIGALGELTVHEHTTKEELAGRLAGAEVVYTNKTPLNAAALEGATQLKFISTLSTGYNTIDLEAAKRLGIVVSNIPSYSTEAVAQHAIALLLEICNQVGRHSAAVHAGKWSESRDFCFTETPLMELAGKTMGFVGFGAIGRCTAGIARALGMRTLAYNRSESEEGRRLAEYVSLDRLLEESDVVSMHLPLSEDTRHLIDAARLARMKEGAILLNTARGPLLDEAAVAEALHSGRLYALGADVASREPIRPDSPLLGAPRCFITPHIAWAPKETRRRLLGIAEENLRAFLAGKPVNVVNS